MNRRTILSLSALCALSWFVACSSGLGKNKRAPAAPATAASSANLPVGLDLGLQPTDPPAEAVVAGVVVPAIGSTSAREVILLGFSTEARADDGDGAGTPLARDTTTDANGAADVFVAAIAATEVEPAAFSQSLAGKFRSPRCVTCHSMQATGTLAFASSPQAHAGPAPGPTFPHSDPSTCAPCHVTSTNFPVEGWMAPAASFDIRSKTVAQLAAMALNVPTGETEHFVSDRRVLWALDSGVLPAVNGRNGIADDDHDGVFEPEDVDGVVRTVPGGSTAFLADLEAWHAAGNPITNADAVVDLTLVSRSFGTSNAGNGASTAPKLLWVANPSFDPTSASTAAATNPIGTLYVAYQSTASDLVATDANAVMDVFRATVELRAEEDAAGNALAGGLNLRASNSGTILVSARDGTTTAGDGASGRPSIGGADADLIAFESLATDLVAGFTDGNGTSGNDVYLRNTTSNATTLVSHAVGNVATGGIGTSEAPSLDSAGRAVAFESDASDLIALDANSQRDVFYALLAGGSPYTKVRASVTAAGEESTGGASSAASVHASSGGRVLVAFQSAMTNLALPTTPNVFLFDSSSGHTTLLNQQVTAGTDATVLGDGAARAPQITADGALVAFESDATNIDVLRNDGNHASDVFLVEVAQLDEGLVLPYRISVSTNHGADGNGASTRPMVGSFAGSTTYRVGFATYATTATNLGTSDSTDLMVAFLDETSGVLADFAASATRGTIPFSVQFTDQSSGSPTSWAWDFDNDGTVDSTVQNPTHVYTTGGTFTVKLVARNANTEGEQITADLIRAIGPSAVSFTTSTTSGPAPLTVNFTDTSTEEPTGWAWDFDNDGTVDSTVQNPSHSYATPGTYTVKLTVTNEHSATSATQTDLIQVFTPVVADFTRTPSSGVVPFSVAFTNTSTGATTYAWDFDNDAVVDSTDVNPSFQYTVAGTYPVTLTATGPGGTDVFTFANCVVASGPVAASFTMTVSGTPVTSAYDTTSVTFTSTSTGSINSLEWDFDNVPGTTEATTSPVAHTFGTVSTTTVFVVRLRASGPGGASVITHNLTIVPSSTTSPSIPAAKDTTIYAGFPNNCNPANVEMAAGLAFNGTNHGPRRALIQFDIEGNIPPNSTILGVQLNLQCTRSPSTVETDNISLHRLTTDWGEVGVSTGGTIGGGSTGTGTVAAVTGDATWNSPIHGIVPSGWNGGTFDSTASSTTAVAGTGLYSWLTSTKMVSDVAGWMNANDNHGWILVGEESPSPAESTARAFASRTHGTPSLQPSLVVTYRLPLP